MNFPLELIGRECDLFAGDLKKEESHLKDLVFSASFLVIGGAGSIGQAVTKEIFKRNPRKLHVVDISENNMVELVRDIRSSCGYINGEFKTFSLDVGSSIYDAFIENDGKYDYVLNLSALKHVRSEKDIFTLMRMIEVNIENTEKTVTQALRNGAKKYFCVSTDKAANPVNMMGASKRIMELFLQRRASQIAISSARFANVAFSDGSLLHGFNKRIEKNQPLSAPNDVRRYFLTPQESGVLCLMSCLLGQNMDVFFPKLDEKLHLITFSEIAERYLQRLGYEPFLCKSEDEARSSMSELSKKGAWPCYFFKSDTSGEKDFEEFYTDLEQIDLDRFSSIGIVKNSFSFDEGQLALFEENLKNMKSAKKWTKNDIATLFCQLLPNFSHLETGKHLDDKM